MGSGSSKSKKNEGKNKKEKQKGSKVKPAEDKSAKPPADEKKSNPEMVAETQPKKKEESAAAPGFDDDDEELDIAEDNNDSDSGAEDLANLKKKEGKSGGKERPKTATGGQIKFINAEEYADYLEKYSRYIFTKADMNEDGVLDEREFTALVQSRTLDLGVSKEDALAMMKRFDSKGDGEMIVFDDFIFVMVEIMALHSKVVYEPTVALLIRTKKHPAFRVVFRSPQRKAGRTLRSCVNNIIKWLQVLQAKDDESWEWFVMYFDDEPDSLPLYYNSQKRQMTYEKPACVTYKISEGDEQDFEILQHTPTETTYTTMVLEGGERWYLHMETGEWLEFPDELLEDCIVVSGDADAGEYEGGDASGTGDLVRFSHARTGEEYDSQLENGVRMVYDPEGGDWIPIPIGLEIYVPEVTRALYKISKELPNWSSVIEKVLALRQHNYSIDLTIAWKLTEMEFDEEDLSTYDPKAVAEMQQNKEKAATEQTQLTTESQAELEKARAKIAELTAQLSQATSMNKMATLDNKSELGKMLALDAELASLKETSAKHEEAATKATRQVAELETDFTTYKKSHESATAAEKAAHEIRVKELSDQLSALQGAGGENDSALTATKSSLAASEKALAESREASSALQAQINDLTGKTAKIGLLSTEITELSEANAALKRDKETAEAANAATTTAASNQALALRKIRIQVDTAKSQNLELRRFVSESAFPGMLETFGQVGQKISALCTTAAEDAVKDIKAQYRYEVRQRKLLYNKLQELRGNIRVFCRVRHDARVNCVLQFPDQKGLGTPTQLLCPDPRDPGAKRKKYEFDRVYSPESTQQDVFDDTEPIMTSACDGYNVTIIAYGQTGSGKTYTMMGTAENPGVNRRAVAELLRVCNSRDQVSYEITVSLLEIYNEKFVDLLSILAVEQQECDLRMDPKTKAGYVTNLTARPVTSVEDVIKTLADGEMNRSTAATKMNSVSSRSHLLLVMNIHGKDLITGQVSRGKLTMVDLAGSERISKTEAEGQRLVEAAAINKSLSALGQVFTALRKNDSHIPYRNSKLTHILQDSLGGDAKTCIFVNVSPAESNLSETVGTINFGNSIRSIELKGGGSKSKKKQ